MKYFFKSVFFLFLILNGNFIVKANITLPEIFADNMVLQQKSDVKIWGWAKPGEPVLLSADWLENSLETKADNQGTWSLILKTPVAGGPFVLRLKGYNEIVFKNVLVGEVWLCSGQSNMEWSANSGIINKEQEIAKANFPEIRFFTVGHSTAKYPQNHCSGDWKVCTPETMSEFSAIGYFFGIRLQEVLDVPIGLINSSWGGTPAEAWIPKEVIQGDDFLKKAAAEQKPVPWGPVEPGRLYNSMIAPLIPYQITGTIWYQGEGNTINPYAYKELLEALITSWRKDWNNDFPFYFAQIAPYKYGENFNGVIVRDEQRQALELENTGMIILSDIGDTLDIHPKNKQGAGLRFANMALNRYYKTIKIEDSGPLFKSMTIEKGKAIIFFTHADGLHSSGKNVKDFEIAGEDGVFYPADAKIKGQTVVLNSKNVDAPKAVRFAWRNTATPDLMNSAKLPASSFSAN